MKAGASFAGAVVVGGVIGLAAAAGPARAEDTVSAASATVGKGRAISCF